jgi:hypothetical protein
MAACGTFAVCGAVFDWEFFMTHWKAVPIVGLLGRKGARIFYGLLGTALIIAGVLAGLGILPETRHARP